MDLIQVQRSLGAMETSLLPDDYAYADTPSMSSGMSKEDETLHRVFGCASIQQAGELLRLRQTAMITGQNLLHRFYYR